MSRFESSELGGTVVRGLMLRVGDVVFYGANDSDGCRVTRIWAVYADGALSCVKLSMAFGKPKRAGSVTTTTDDGRIQFIPGPEGQAMEPGEWAPGESIWGAVA